MQLVELDDTDELILSILNEDARTPTEEIAAEVGLSTAEVERSIERLQDEGVITKFTTMIDTAKLGYISVAFGFSVEPGKTDEIAKALSKYDNIYKLWILSGRHNLIAHANFKNITEFQDFTSNNLHDIDGITNYESSIVTKSVLNEGGVVLNGERR
jgi:DNA-binding Lrp family transcriptional regulator